MNKQKGFGLTGILVILPIITAIGGAGYYVWRNNQEPEQVSESVIQKAPAESEEDKNTEQKESTAQIPYGWVKYEDNKISFYYPPDWTYNNFEVEELSIEDSISPAHGQGLVYVYDKSETGWTGFTNLGTEYEKEEEIYKIDEPETTWKLRKVESSTLSEHVVYFREGCCTGVSHVFLVVKDNSIFKVTLPYVEDFEETNPELFEKRLKEQSENIEQVIHTIVFSS